VPLPVVRVLIRSAVKLQSRAGRAAAFEAKPPVERVAGRSGSADLICFDSRRQSDKV